MALAEMAMVYPIYFIVLLAAILTTATTLVQKKFTDQEHLKSLKKRQKEIQKELKNAKEPSIMKELNSEMLSLTGIMFKKSMKPMFVTMIPILLIIGWAYANIAYDPLAPGDEFFIEASFGNDAFGDAEINVPEGIEIVGESIKEINGEEARWILKGDVGEYNIEVLFGGDSAEKEVIITEDADYADIEKKYKGQIKRILIGNEKRIYFNLFGWELGWLGAYILLSILFSIGLRKVLDVA